MLEYGYSWSAMKHTNCFIDTYASHRTCNTWTWGSLINVNYWGRVSLCGLSNLISVDQSQGYRPGHICSYVDPLCVKGVSSVNSMTFPWEPVKSTKILVLSTDSKVCTFLCQRCMARVEMQPSFMLMNSCPSLLTLKCFLKIWQLLLHSS